MKIIGGQHAGYVIRPPKNLKARPTTAIAKEALFNILNNRYHFEGLKVLDLFSGSGSIGLEFASRGAGMVYCLDFSMVTHKFLEQISEDLNLGNLVALKGEAVKYLQNATQKFDIIFADPPYGMQNIDAVINTVFERELLAEGGILIMEHDKHVRLTPSNFQESRKYGHTSFSFYGSAK